MKLFMWQCLLYAHSQQLSSVAFPALGTGNRKYPWKKVAKTMLDVIDDFGRQYQDTPIKEVRVVLYEKDPKTINVSTLYDY